MNEFVIIGNGVAAVGCIEGIRASGGEGPITVVSAENHPVYSRPLISYYLEGRTDRARMQYREADFYEKNGCSVLYGVTAERIDPAAKRVFLSDGSVLPYAKLCVATGSSPFVPPTEGLEQVAHKFTFLTLDDALALEGAVTKQSRVLVVGAGLIGLKCVEGILNRVQSVTVCDLADRVLSSILDADCAGIVQQHLEAHGVRIMLQDRVVRFSPDAATFQSGQVVPFDVLVTAVGVRPNTALLKPFDGAVNRGILVNTRTQTTLSDVSAAGDCAEGFDSSIGRNRVLALLPNAYRMGYTAGTNMAGGAREDDRAIPMNSIGFFGLHIMTAGAYQGTMTEQRTDGAIRRFYTEDGLLKGFILIGDTERAGIYTALIRNRTPLDSIDFGAMKKIASSLYFSSETRRKNFGGIV